MFLNDRCNFPQPHWIAISEFSYQGVFVFVRIRSILSVNPAFFGLVGTLIRESLRAQPQHYTALFRIGRTLDGSRFVQTVCLCVLTSNNKRRTGVDIHIKMVLNVPKVKFYNGNEVPIFGLGTWKSKPGEVTQAVKDAIDIGYRHIDCAHVYGNEKEVGVAIQAKIAEGVVKREDLFITSKLWNTFHRPDLVEPAIKQSLADFGLEYIDLYLIHWPVGYKEDKGTLFPTTPEGAVILSDVDYVDTWKAMEDVLAKGLTKNIGVSNFNSKQITRILENASVKPVINQIECHPYLTQKKLSDFCREKGIFITAYSPLGSPDRPWAKPDDPKLLEDKKLIELGQKYNKTPAQILIRYQLDRGHIVIPKSVNKSRIAQNSEVFDFKLSPDDIAYIDSFDCNGRICPLLGAEESPYYPFNIPF